MNLAIVIYLLGRVLELEAAFLLPSALTALLCGDYQVAQVYLFTAVGTAVIGFLMSARRPRNTAFFAKEGFVTVSLSWIVLGMVGALPMRLTGEISHYIDAVFETISGFTTTGATILGDVEVLSNATLLWRSMTHWVGGMGVLVFILAVMPMAGGHSIYLLRAESPGPSVGKLLPRLRQTAMLLYGIYLFLTAAEFLLLVFGGMPLFDALNASLATAGTGGFGIKNASIGFYDSAYLQNIISLFMILFGINFSLYYVLLSGHILNFFRSEELRLYLGIIAASSLLIAYNVRGYFSSFGEALHHAVFSVGSIITTTGFSTVDFDQWPNFSRAILVLLMFIGACAGSTGGGIKVIRIHLLIKSVRKELNYLIHPRSIRIVTYEGKRVPHEMVRSVNVFMVVYIMVFVCSFMVLTIDQFDLVTNFTAVAATLNNIGPGLAQVGPTCNFGGFSILSKLVLIFDMLAGRLELFPMLILFMPATWKKQ